MSISASSVSRVLAQGGLRPVVRHQRDGVSVSRTYRADQVLVSSSVDDDPKREAALALQACDILRAKGYVVELDANAEATLAYVSKLAR